MDSTACPLASLCSTCQRGAGGLGGGPPPTLPQGFHEELQCQAYVVSTLVWEDVARAKWLRNSMWASGGEHLIPRL
eukprot:6432233-Pyramimonas_sp.AAC.1